MSAQLDLDRCGHAADDRSGPVVATCVRLFDFTLLFEQSILSIPFDCLFLMLAGCRIWHLFFSTHKARPNWRLSAKLLGTFGLITTSLAALILQATETRLLTSTSITSAAVAFVASMMLPPLSYLEHVKSIRPSTLLGCYLMLSCLLRLPEIRTLYLTVNAHEIAAVSTAGFCLKVCLLVVETWEKRQLLAPDYRDLSVEMTSGIFNRSLFVWLNPLFWLGFHRPVMPDDLSPPDSQLHSEAIHDGVKREWGRQRLNCRAPLARALFRGLRGSFLAPIPARLCYAALLLAQPFLIRRAIYFLQQAPTSMGNDIGYGLIGQLL